MSKQEIMDIIESALALEGVMAMDGSESHLLIQDGDMNTYTLRLEEAKK